MRRNLLYKFWITCIGILFMAHVHAQVSYQYKSSLNEIKAPGFYKIALPPEIVAKSKNELNDIRILNNKGNQVPYILRSDKTTLEEKSFVEFPILDMKRQADKQTHIVIGNKADKAISELLLVIKNTEAQRIVTLSGSDDQKKWFVIREHIPLSTISANEKDRFIQSLTFPKSSYKFFELIINGKDVLPVNIVKVGLDESTLHTGEYIAVPEPVITQTDSTDKRSYIHLALKENYQVDRLELKVDAPKFFRRNFIIRKEDDYFSNNYILSSDIKPSYNINIKAKTMLLIVENQDNPPLKIQSAKVYQLNRYLLAYLEPANNYDLMFGDSTVNAPTYDLEFFKDSLNNNVDAIIPGLVTTIKTVKPALPENGIKSKVFLWSTLGGVLLLLIILTFRMTKEMAKKNQQENN